MKHKKLYYILAMCLLMWLLVIFIFSAQPVEKSVGISRVAGQKLSEWFVPGFAEMQQNRQMDFVESIDFGIRKTAHFLEYMILGIWWWLIFIPADWRKGLKIGICVGISALCAVMDEIHQMFVPGRTSRWQDVCIDTAGAAVGVLMAGLIAGFVIRRKKKRAEKG